MRRATAQTAAQTASWTRLWLSGAVIACVSVLAGCDTVVRSKLSERDADALLLALDDAAIVARKQRARGGTDLYDLTVGRTELPAALRALSNAGLLEAPQPAFEAIYAEPGLVPSPADERARLAFATAGELARSIERIDSVLDARVHVAAPVQIAPLDAPAARWKASVLIRRRAGTPALDERAIQALIAGAIDGLEPASITVMQSAAAPRPSTSAWARIGPFTVALRDAGAMRLAFAAALTACAGLATTLIVVVARRRR